MVVKLYKLAVWYIGKCNAKWDKGHKRELEQLGRLTYRNCGNIGTNYLLYGADAEWQKFSRYDVLYNAIQKLANYEDAEEQGLLLRLPCPIGTTVYNTTWGDDVLEEVKVDGKTYYRRVLKHKVSESKFSCFDIESFGKTVFLTKEEAEQKLA